MLAFVGILVLYLTMLITVFLADVTDLQRKQQSLLTVND